jgi:hypothetical protein
MASQLKKLLGSYRQRLDERVSREAGRVFTSTATQLGGRNPHSGFDGSSFAPWLRIVRMPYSIPAQTQIESMQGGTTYGMSQLGGKGREPASEEEAGMARASAPLCPIAISLKG